MDEEPRKPQPEKKKLNKNQRIARHRRKIKGYLRKIDLYRDKIDKEAEALMRLTDDHPSQKRDRVIHRKVDIQ